MNKLSMFTWIYVQKWKQIEFIPASHHVSNCHRSSLLLFTCAHWIIWKPNSNGVIEDRWTLQQLLQNQRRAQIFLGFRIFETRAKETSKIFLDFWVTNLTRRWRKLKQGTKETTKEKQQKYFWSFCVLESKNKTRTTAKRRKAKYGYTKIRQNMICRWVWCRCTSPQA